VDVARGSRTVKCMVRVWFIWTKTKSSKSDFDPGTAPAGNSDGFFCRHCTDLMKFLRWFGESVLLVACQQVILTSLQTQRKGKAGARVSIPLLTELDVARVATPFSLA